MCQYIIKKILGAIPVLIGISLVAFTLGIIMPGDPVDIALGAGGEYNPTPEQIEIMRERLGLNLPYHEQYINWLKNAACGDLGISFHSKRPIILELKQRIPYTFRLAFISIFLTTSLGISSGIIMAIYKGSFIDTIKSFLSIVYVSVPSFWFSIILMAIFSEKLKLLPTSGVDGIKTMILPSVALSISSIGSVARLTRAQILNQENAEYLNAARSKGLSENYVFVHHGLKNAIIPVIALLGTNFGSILGGSVIIENIFAIGGIGKYALEALALRDYPVLQGYVLVTGLTFVLINLLVDLIYYFVNPKIKRGVQ